MGRDDDGIVGLESFSDLPGDSDFLRLSGREDEGTGLVEGVGMRVCDAAQAGLGFGVETESTVEVGRDLLCLLVNVAERIAGVRRGRKGLPMGRAANDDRVCWE